MPMYDVEYAELVPEYNIVRVEAESLDDAEFVAMRDLLASDQDQERQFFIEMVKEVKN